MSTVEKNAAPKAAGDAKLVPPDQQFWKRYSPHHELPLSGASSFALHTLLIGMILLIAWFAWAMGLNAPPPKVPNEGVRLDVGGGGGPKGGKESGKGRNTERKGERVDAPKDKPPEDDPERKSLDPESIKQDLPPELAKNPDLTRRIAEGKNLSFLKDLNSDAGKKLRQGVKAETGSGDGGPGKDGGKDGGKDKGEGDGTGTGKSAKVSLNEREERMLRWVMAINTSGSPNEYFHQLSGLGAILAIPTDGPEQYKIIYYPPGVKPVKDVTELNRIYWKDYNPNSIRDMMRSLRQNVQPNHFVAFMPHDLEERLYKMEEERARSKGKTIDDVFETKFKVFRVSATKYDASLESQTYK